MTRRAKTAVFASLISFGLLSGANAGESVSSDELAREATGRVNTTSGINRSIKDETNSRFANRIWQGQATCVLGSRESLAGIVPPAGTYIGLDAGVVALYPWSMLPVMPVIIDILAFHFFGDGLRDAADPYK